MKWDFLQITLMEALYLEGLRDLVSRLITPISHIVSLVILVVNLCNT